VTRLGLLVADLGPATAGRSTLSDVSSLAVAAEQAGFDSFWVEDDQGGGVAPADSAEAGFEAYSLLGALATRTHTVRLGAFPLGGDPRAPAALAKIVTSIDVISGGRGVVTLAPGPLDEPAALDRLAEGLQVCRAVLDDQHPGFAGTHFAIDGAVNQPPPVQPGGVPLVVRLDTAERSWVKALHVAMPFTDAVVVDGDLDAVSLAADAVSGQESGTEVIWTGAVPASEREAVATITAVAAAGATGCIIAVPGAQMAPEMTELGPALLEAMELARAPGSHSR